MRSTALVRTAGSSGLRTPSAVQNHSTAFCAGVKGPNSPNETALAPHFAAASMTRWL